MENRSKDIPEQRVSLNKKLTSANWYEPTIDYWIDLAQRTAQPYQKIANESLDIANGDIDPNEYKHIMSPLAKSSDEKVRSLKLTTPMRSTDFISAIRDKSLGEYIELPFPVTVISNSEKAIIRKKNFVKRKLMAYAVERFMSEVNKIKQQAEQQGQEVTEDMFPDSETYVNEVIEEFLNNKADVDAKILKLIRNEVDFEIKRSEAYVNWWMTEQFYTMCGIEGNNVTYDIIPVTEGFPVCQYGENVEDGDAFLYKYRLSYNQMVDEYRDQLSNSDMMLLNHIENATGKNGAVASFGLTYGDFIKAFPNRAGRTDDLAYKNSLSEWTNETVLIHKLFFKSETKVKIVTYIDLDGSQKDIVLPADYKLNPEIGDITFRYDWINVVFEATRIGDTTTGLYIPPRIIPVQLSDRNNPSRCKLPVGGRVGLVKGIKLKPVPIRLKPYQIIDNILVNRIEAEIAKYQSFIEAIPKSALAAMDDSIGKAFYSIKNNSLMIYDDDKLKPQELVNGVRFIVNDSLYNYIKVLMELRDKNKEDAYDTSSVNNDSLGNIDTKSVKGNVEYNIARARLGMVLGVQLFNNALSKDLTKLLEYSKIAWERGKAGHIENKDGKLENFSVNIEEHMESEYGIFVKNSKSSQDKINHYVQLAQAGAQNDMMELAIESVDFDNMPGAKQTLLDAIKAKRDFDREMAEYNRKSASENIQAQVQDKQAQRQHEIQLEQLKQEYETQRESMKLEMQMIIEQMKLAGASSEGNVDSQYLKTLQELQKDKAQELKQLDLKFKERKHKEDLAFKNKQLQTQKEIAKMNKN
jgi:hypothetical protein